MTIALPSLAEITLVIPFKLDFPERMQNLESVLRFWTRRFSDLDLVIVESGEGPSAEGLAQSLAGMGVSYRFYPNEVASHRTRYFNDALKRSSRPFISLLDTDVILYPEAVLETLATLRSNPEALFVFPYSGVFLDIGGDLKQRFLEDFDFTLIPLPTRYKPNTSYGPDMRCFSTISVGGAPFFNRAFLLALGGYNAGFVSWGWEDTEIVYRYTALGKGIQHISAFPLLHLRHGRGPDSSDKHDYYKKNYKEFKRIRRLSPLGLCQYIDEVLGGRVPESVREWAASQGPVKRLLHFFLGKLKLFMAS